MSALSSSLYLALGIATATGIGATFSTSSPSTDEPGQTVRAPAALVITSPRICAALEVYTLANENDWGLRTTIAQAVLNGFSDAGRVPDCAAGVSAALAKDFSPTAGSSRSTPSTPLPAVPIPFPPTPAPGPIPSSPCRRKPPPRGGPGAVRHL